MTRRPDAGRARGAGRNPHELQLLTFAEVMDHARTPRTQRGGELTRIDTRPFRSLRARQTEGGHALRLGVMNSVLYTNINKRSRLMDLITILLVVLYLLPVGYLGYRGFRRTKPMKKIT